MSCIKNRHKLIALCCCVLVIALVSAAMIINAFFNWSNQPSLSLIASTVFPPTLKTQLTFQKSSLDQKSGLDMEIKIHELTTSPRASAESKRRWFELQKYNTEDTVIDVGVIDIDNDIISEVSGSGSIDDDESGDDYIPTVAEKDNSIELTTSSQSKFTDQKLHGGDAAEKVSRLELSGESTDSHHAGSHDIAKNFSNHIGNQVNQSASSSTDKCEAWLNCEDPFLEDYLKKFSQLPTCPCTYPLNKGGKVYDPYHKKAFQWKDPQYTNTYLYAYHKGAKNCIRSEIGTGTLAAQNCCYDKSGKLLTRGSGAGTPVVISPEVSSALHQLVDQVPWILCKGDWTRYNIARPPNNVQGCTENPSQLEFLYQIWLAKNH